MLSYTCIVRGTVTGGNFQSWALDTAQQLKICGWVRNIADGTAEILIQGSAEAYTVFRERLKNEAPIPTLIDITCNSIEYDKVHDKFEIRG